MAVKSKTPVHSNAEELLVEMTHTYNANNF